MSDTHDDNGRWRVLGDHRLRAGVRIAAVSRRTGRDLFGRKWTFISGAVGFAVASAAGGTAQSFGWLVIPRAAQGVFGAALARAHGVSRAAVRTALAFEGAAAAIGQVTPWHLSLVFRSHLFKTLHILSYIDTDETYRRDIKGIRNLQEGRHALPRKICHGKKGELYHRYERGLENQLGSLGLVLNCVVLWTTVYLDAAVSQLRAQGYPVLDEDMARLSPFVSTHLGVHGTYSFVLPDLAPGAIRDLRNPDAADEDDE